MPRPVSNKGPSPVPDRDRPPSAAGVAVGDVRNAKPADAREGGDVDDHALALPLHVRELLLAGQEHAPPTSTISTCCAARGEGW